MKKCSKCGQTKPKSEFCKSSTSKDGYRSQCKECGNEQRRKKRAKARGRIAVIFQTDEGVTYIKLANNDILKLPKPEGYNHGFEGVEVSKDPNVTIEDAAYIRYLHNESFY